MVLSNRKNFSHRQVFTMTSTKLHQLLGKSNAYQIVLTTDGTICHAICDRWSVMQMVEPFDRKHCLEPAENVAYVVPSGTIMCHLWTIYDSTLCGLPVATPT